MTANQIAYAQAKEQARHNKAQEDETLRHNYMQEQIGLGNLLVSTAEAYTHQKVGDAQATKYLADTYYQVQKSKIEQGQLMVNLMDAFTRAAVGDSTIEKNRAEAYSAYEGVKIGWYEASIKKYQADASWLQANASMLNAFTNQYNAKTTRDVYLMNRLQNLTANDLHTAEINQEWTRISQDWRKLELQSEMNQVQKVTAVIGALGTLINSGLKIGSTIGGIIG